MKDRHFGILLLVFLMTAALLIIAAFSDSRNYEYGGQLQEGGAETAAAAEEAILTAGGGPLAAFTPVFSGFGRRAAAASAPEISARCAIVIDGSTGEELYGKSPDERVYPASVTKIMTALLTLETLEKWGSDIGQMIMVPQEAVGVEGSSIYLEANEQISVEDLLYGLMLRSGNDASVALAELIGGRPFSTTGGGASWGTQRFVEQMNSRAAELGCTDTHFMNPDGLYDDNHYTTCRDMALIAKEAMKHEAFRKIAAAEDWQANRSSESYAWFYNKNKVVHQYEGGNGIKIGYTKKSGRTLAASAERDGRLLICIVMDASDWFNDAYRLMDWCFEQESDENY